MEHKEEIQEQLKAEEAFERKVMENFNIFDSEVDILTMQFNTDFSIISEKLLQWEKAAKNESQKKTIKELISALIRMLSYGSTVNTISKRSKAEWIVYKNIALKSALENRDLKKSNEILKKEIEYYEKESGK